MKYRLGCAILVVSFLGLTLGASARDVVLPAGTLLQCALNEPNFSSATVALGDPVLCHLSGMVEFGQQVFPRGSSEPHSRTDVNSCARQAAPSIFRSTS